MLLATSINVMLTKTRHLLQETTVHTYIPNDAFIVGGKGDRSQTIERGHSTSSNSSDIDGPSMTLLTGPNYSGKSVYQKQIALAVYMAHIGSFVPAETAVIGLTDKILTRIRTRETVSKTQSAFMIDVQQVALALNQATRRSLLIIDEFGKGTDSCGESNYHCSPDKAQRLDQHFLASQVKLIEHRWCRAGGRRLQVSPLIGCILSKSPRCNPLPRDLRARVPTFSTQPSLRTYGSARR